MQLTDWLANLAGATVANRLATLLDVPSDLQTFPAERVPRAVLAQALNMLLFDDLVRRVPEGAAYVQDRLDAGEKICFDHGALRTVLAPCGALPVGQTAITRILKPLGYQEAGTYPLPHLRMTGRAYCHIDYPEQIAQFFVSELHPEQFSESFQKTVQRVIGHSTDPLTSDHQQLLGRLQQEKALPIAEASYLMGGLLACFDRQHALPTSEDYDALLRESAEMAWISTEGNMLNHVTDRVVDVFSLTEKQRALGRSIKPQVEVSKNGRVRQTALRAAQVERVFRTGQGSALRKVPGSFYEFITRDFYTDEKGQRHLDLTFDSANATGIFKMTDANM